MARGPIEIYRCLTCRRLINSYRIRKKGACICGARRVSGASPLNLIEYIKCLWWSITLP